MRRYFCGRDAGPRRKRLQVARKDLPRQIAGLGRGRKQERAAGEGRHGRRVRASQTRIAARALGDSGTMRSLLPLPVTTKNRSSRMRHSERQADQFRHAQAGGIENFDQCMHAGGGKIAAAVPTASAAARSSSRAGFGLAHRLRQRAILARTIQRAGRIVGAQAFGIEELEELPQRRQFRACEVAAKPLLGDAGEIGAHFGGIGIGKTASSSPASCEVAAIAGKRVVRRAPFGAHHFQERPRCGRRFSWSIFLGSAFPAGMSHAHLGLSWLDNGHQRKHRAIGQGREIPSTTISVSVA